MHLADAFIQSDLQLHPGYTFSLVCVFPGNRTHNLLRHALPLSHTGTPILINVENSFAALYFCGNLFSGLFDEYKVQTEFISNINLLWHTVNGFTATFDQFNASLLNKSTNFLKKSNLTQTSEEQSNCDVIRHNSDFISSNFELRHKIA